MLISHVSIRITHLSSSFVFYFFRVLIPFLEPPLAHPFAGAA
jgi:hypothetical protein